MSVDQTVKKSEPNDPFPGGRLALIDCDPLPRGRLELIACLTMCMDNDLSYDLFSMPETPMRRGGYNRGFYRDDHSQRFQNPDIDMRKDIRRFRPYTSRK